MRNTVSQSEVVAVPEIEGTETWNPIHHAKVINGVEHALDHYALGIRDKCFELSDDGMNMFATYSLDQGGSELAWQIGFRNSMNKRFAVGITAGTKIYVCSNLVFTGDFIELRKHTKMLSVDQLMHISSKAVENTIWRIDALQQWQESLKEVPLTEQRKQELTYECMLSRVFPPSKFFTFVENFDTERYMNDDTLYSFHGAATRTIRQFSLGRIASASRILNGIINRELSEEAGSQELNQEALEV